jgi:hypothetical protein
MVNEWVVIEIGTESGERRYARIRRQVPKVNPLTSDAVLLQVELWGGPIDGELGALQMDRGAADEILAAIEP